jgi:hypothetical protein
MARRESAKTPAGKVSAKESSETLAKAFPDRKALYVCNPSTKEVWLALGATAVKEEGIWLKKEGGAAVIEDYTGIVTLITTSGEGAVTFTEV